MACGGVAWIDGCQFVPSLVAATLLVAVGLWVFLLDFRNRVHQAFSLFLFVLAGVTGMIAFDATALSFPSRIRSYFIIAAPFAALFFAYAYRRRYARGAVPRQGGGRAWIPWAILAAAALAEGLYVYNRDFFVACDAGTCLFGFLALLWPLGFVAYAGIGLLFAIDFVAAPKGPCRRALYLASLGFALVPLQLSGFLFTFSISNGFMVQTGLWVEVLDDILWAAPALLVGAQAVWLMRATRDADDATRRAVRRFVTILPFPLLAGVAMAGSVLLWPDRIAQFVFTNFIITAILTTTLAGLIAYSLARHQLFNIDLKVRIAISRTTLASIFVAVFFVVSEGTAALVGDRLGGDPFAVGLGIVAAGMLLFALHPLQTWASRVAQATMPGARSISDMTSDERLELYREQAELAWLDGSLTAKERMLLDRLRDRIGLSLEEANQIENDVMMPVGKATRQGHRGRPA